MLVLIFLIDPEAQKTLLMITQLLLGCIHSKVSEDLFAFPPQFRSQIQEECVPGLICFTKSGRYSCLLLKRTDL